MTHKEPVRPRKKAFHHKTRNGCSVCRQRRVKCDEGRPSCQKCIRIGFQCPGYALQRSSDRPMVPAAIVNHSSLTANANTIFADDQEWQYFQVFQSKHLRWYLQGACYQNGATFCYTAWGALWFPLMHSQPMFRHLVLALSAAHSFGNPDGSLATEVYSPAQSNELFFLKQHGQALKYFSQAYHTTDITLMLCAALFFSIIEGCLRRPAAMLGHMKGGNQMLQQYELLQSKPDQHYAHVVGQNAFQDYVKTLYNQLNQNAPRILKKIMSDDSDGGRVLAPAIQHSFEAVAAH